MFIVFATIIAVTAASRDRLEEKLTTPNGSHGNLSSVCKTPICFQEASTILKKIDPSVSPCNNFYQFACGKFIDAVIPDDALAINIRSSIQHKLKNQLLSSLSDEITKDDLPVFHSMKSSYQTCMDTEKILKNTENELKEVLEKLGGWPILHGLSWNETNFEWEKFVIESGQMGYDTSSFININVGTDSDNTSKYIIQIDYPEFGITPEISPDDENSPAMEAYVKFMYEVAIILGANLEEVEEDFKSLLTFEQNLLHISRSNTINTYEYRTTISELRIEYPKISWIEYINGILAPHAYVGQNEEVTVVNDFLDGFSDLISSTPKRVLANYGIWHIIWKSILMMEGPLTNALVEFLASINGKQVRVSRREMCFRFLDDYFSTALGSLYVRRYFDKTVKTKVANLVKDIRDSFHDMIEQANWMERVIKTRALEKLDLMGEYIGYPDELMDDEKLNEYYKNLIVHPESFLKCQISLNKFRKEQRLLYLRKAADDTKWVDHSGAHRSTAFFFPVENAIDIRAGFLQEEFFHSDRPNYMNYGGIGWTIGHEMAHGYDNTGIEFDKNGNQANWWKSETRGTYSKKVNCIIEQYNNYVVKDINMTIQGHLTQDENIADNGGIRAAYYAYNKWARVNDPEPQLPGLDYTPQQMFWISAATSHCEKLVSKYLESLVQTDTHPPEEFRVIGSMSNMPEFSKDFNCSPGSLMNPKKKCTVW